MKINPRTTKLDYIKTYKLKHGPTIIALHLKLKKSSKIENILFGVTFEDNPRGRYFIKYGITKDEASIIIESAIDRDDFLRSLREPKYIGEYKEFRKIIEYHRYLHNNGILFYFPTKNNTEYQQFLALISESIDSLAQGSKLDKEKLKEHLFRREHIKEDLEQSFELIQRNFSEFKRVTELSDKKQEDFDLLTNFLHLYEDYIKNLLREILIKTKRDDIERERAIYLMDLLQIEIKKYNRAQNWIKLEITHYELEIEKKQRKIDQIQKFKKILKRFRRNYDNFKDLYLIPIKNHLKSINN